MHQLFCGGLIKLSHLEPLYVEVKLICRGLFSRHLEDPSDQRRQIYGIWFRAIEQFMFEGSNVLITGCAATV